MLQKFFFLFLGFFLWETAVQAQDLTISPEDLRIEQRLDGGFHLFIRKKPGIASVLITETTRDPSMNAHNYAYRAPEWNPVNGDEIRLLEGRPIPRENRVYSLISSTPVRHPALGEVFHIFIPWILNYGYDTTRSGEIYVSNGTYLNIRAFSLPYGDYRGTFRDNPFVLWVTQRPEEEPEEEIPDKPYMEAAVESFKELVGPGGTLVYSKGPEDLVDKIENILRKEEAKELEIVVCVDTTGSMENEIGAIKRDLVPMLRNLVGDLSFYQIGMVFYKDYYEDYLTRLIPFTTDFGLLQRQMNAIVVEGGGDVPEAVHEALYDGLIRFPWEAENRVLILVGDAPAHPRPRGRITKAMVDEAAEQRKVKVSAIILPP